MSNIYKLYHNTGKIQKIYIFVGDLIFNENISISELETLYTTDRDSKIINSIFFPDELQKIVKNKIEVIFVDDNIYNDDTIENVKFKLLKELRNYSYEELYMYGFTEYKVDRQIIYNELTNNNNIPMTKIILSNFLNNIGKQELIDTLPTKENYDLEDFYNLPLTDENLIKVALGQKFITTEKELSYVIDPFNTITVDSILQKYSQDIVSTSNKNLLFEYGLVNNIIYFILLEDIESIVSDVITMSSLIKVYYPYIYNDDIEDFETYILNKSKYYSRTEKILHSPSFTQYNSSISLLNKLSHNDNIKYNKIGLKNIELNLHPNNTFNFPIDVIFKLISSSKEAPLIKFNPGKGQENVYRLYTERKSINGKKIPFLKKTLIFQLMKTIGTKKSVTIYNYGKEKIPIIFQFNSDGIINIKIMNNKPVNLQFIQERIIYTLNPIIKILQEKLQDTGYKFNYFDNILDKNVEIINVQYYSEIKVDNNINLTQIKSCISNIFNIKNYNLTSGISMRYKRVSNYNEMNAIDSSIVELIKLQYREIEIIKNIVDNYKISEELAKEKITSVINNLQLVQNLYRTNKIKIKNNPGFLTTIDKDKFKNIIYINMYNIDSLEYIDNITTFINSIIKITQKKSISERETQQISELCKNKIVKEEKYIDDIVAHNEKEYAENAEIKLDTEEIIFDDDKIDKIDEIAEIDEMDKIHDDKELMDFFLGESDDEDEIDDDSDDSSKTQIAGVIDDDFKDITGKNIANPSPFFKKLKEYEPTLFLTENDSKFNAYSRICPSNLKRQPVLLTDEEKDKIDKQHPGSYTKAIKYGSSPDKQYWYICPRYWSLRDNVSLTQEQVDSGDYGSIIPHDSKIVPPGGNIYEFNSTYHKDKNKEYKNLYPGYMESSKHPDGKCIPCCFKTWDTPSQLKRRQECETGISEINKDKKTKTKKDTETKEKDKIDVNTRVPEGESQNDIVEQETDILQDEEVQDEEFIGALDSKSKKIDEYIKGPEKFPLEVNKWGYIPLAIQYLLDFDTRKCYISKLNTNLKPFMPCLIRRGIEQNSKNSFISAIANIYRENMTAKEFIKLLVSSITIDKFVRYNNGNLLQLFRNKVEDIDKLKDIDISQYSDTKIYNSIDISNPKHSKYLKTAIQSFSNYISFLNSDTSIIDHTYIWDIICSPDKNIFIQGVNIIIFEINQNDFTDNVNIVCPTNNYSNNFFDPDKKTILLIKQDKYYEPIYAVEDTKLKFSITKLFNLKNKDFLPELKKTLITISKSLTDKCTPKSSVNVVNFKKNISLEKILNIILSLKFEVDYQVIDYNNKVIGIYITRDDVFGYLPTYPSAINTEYEYPIKFMDDVEWNNYDTTKLFLETVYIESKERIACLPQVKILEDKMIVGILTNGNQFVKLDNPVVDKYKDELIIQEERDYIKADLKIQDPTIESNIRKDTIRNIELEESFYNKFRNILRNNLKKREYLKDKDLIKNIIHDKANLYIDKLEKLNKIIREVMENSVVFSEIGEGVFSNIKEIINCNEKQKNCSDLNYCMLTTGEKCVQILPIKNLINGLDNNELYYAKIADELIRYNKIQQFIINSDNYLSLPKIDYDIKEYEILIIQSLLNNSFFQNLTAITPNTHTNYTTYDSINPLKTKFYTNEARMEQYRGDDYGIEDSEDLIEISDSGCSLTKKLLIGYLQEQFPPKTYEIYYRTPNSICTYEIILNILRDYDGKFSRLSILDFKKNVVEIYKYYKDNIKLLIILLIELNKKVILERVLDQVVNMDEMLLSDEYYLTYIDMILIAKYYNLPVIIISSMPIVDKLLPDTIIIPNKIKTDKWYFIKVPSIVTRVKKNDFPVYKLLSLNNNLKINIDVVSKDLRENIEKDLENPRDILTFLLDNIKPKKKYKLKIIEKVKPVKQKLKIVE